MKAKVIGSKQFLLIYLLLSIDLSSNQTLFKKVAQSKYGRYKKHVMYNVSSLIECGARCTSIDTYPPCLSFKYKTEQNKCFLYNIWKVSEQPLYDGDFTEPMYIQQGLDLSNY